MYQCDRADSLSPPCFGFWNPCPTVRTWGTFCDLPPWAPGSASAACNALLGGEFFLFAFHAHGFEFAFFGVVGFLDFSADPGSCFFETSLPKDCDVVLAEDRVVCDQGSLFHVCLGHEQTVERVFVEFG